MNDNVLKIKNGKLITLSMSVLASALVFANQQDTISAEHVNENYTTNQPEPQDNLEENSAVNNDELTVETEQITETLPVEEDADILEINENTTDIENDAHNVESKLSPSSSDEEIINSVTETELTEPIQIVEPDNTEFVSNPLDTYTPEEFIDKFGESAQKIAEENDLYASVMLAQAALESAWGNSELAQSSSNNLFGIKGDYQGNSTNITTNEDDGAGQLSQIEADFRSYADHEESLKDYASFLTGKETPWRKDFYEGARRSVAQSYQDATAHLTGKYATDINYGDSLNRIIDQYDLTRFDTTAFNNQDVEVFAGEENQHVDTFKVANTDQIDVQSEVNSSITKSVQSEQATTPNSENSPSEYTTVKKGDTLYSIAQQNNLTVNQLRDLNNLSGTTIHPGQQLIVTKKVENTRPDSNVQTDRVTVETGDTLYRIAQNNNISVQELRQYNNIKDDLIHPGQQLIVSKKVENTRPDNNIQTDRVTVKTGDTLYRIAQNNNISVQELRQYNNIKDDLIHPGQQLKLKPNQTSKKREEKATEITPSKTDVAKTITVQRGDTLYGLATQNKMSVDDLRRLNGLSGNIIVPGQKLRINEKQATQNNKTNDAIKTNIVKHDTVTVKPGETLYRIALNNQITVEQLRSLNNITGDIIHPGQQLKIKPTAEKSIKPVEKPEKPSATPTATHKYTVQKGDTLYKIATANGLTVNQLKQLNNLSSNIIVTGQSLVVTNNTGANPSISQKDSPTYTGNNLPDLTDAESVEVNYDVKLNGKVEPFRKTLSASADPVSVLNYFGDKFTVTRELTHNGTKFLELSNNGIIAGYVPASAAVQVPQNVRTVYVDAGHGGSETGAYSFGTAEKDLNMAISNRLSDLLRGKGYHVYETRRNDKTVSLTERSNATNEIMPDIFVSIHHNAMANPGSARGIEVLYHDPSIDEPNYMTMDHHKGTDIIPEGRRLAQSLQTGLVNATNGINRGIRAQNLHVTRVTDVPAALVELGFQDNPQDYQLLTNPSYQTKLVQGLVDGIDAYFTGIK